jgi:hypothetical protein
MEIKEGDKVRSKQLPCLGEGTVEYVDDSPPPGSPNRLDLRIVTVRWEQDPHGHLPEDHSPREDWDFEDLVLVTPCEICGPDHMSYGFHMTGEHDEQLVNNADAVDTGELVVVPANLIYGALEALEIRHTLNEFAMANVDRRILQAIVDSIKELDPYGDPSVGIFENWDLTGSLEELQNYLNDNPVTPESEREA